MDFEPENAFNSNPEKQKNDRNFNLEILFILCARYFSINYSSLSQMNIYYSKLNLRYSFKGMYNTDLFVLFLIS